MNIMKIVGSLFVAAIIGTSSAHAAAVGCEAASWSPEVYTFYGDSDTIGKKIDTISVTLSERRTFVQVTESKGFAEVKFFEKRSDGNYDVQTWRGKSVDALTAKLDKAIVDNKGVNCVGEQTKALLKKTLPKTDTKDAVPAPASTRAAFFHSVKEAGGDFIKTTIYILC
jgi:hypothetical protein